MDIVLLFPGQGSQTPGMGKDLVDAFPAARAVFERADRAYAEAASGAGHVSLAELCFNGPAEELMRTHNAQPALLAHGAALWEVLRPAIAADVRAAAGHSLGEFTAHCAAGSLSLEAAVALVRRRGDLMYESGVKRPGTMAAILGLADEAVEHACALARAEGGVVVPANYNAPEQVVISGEVAAVERAMSLCKEAGARRAVRLQVSGAFHSPLMSVATAGLNDALERAAFGASAVPVYSNVTASAVPDASSAARLLLEQLTAPVRWTQEVRTIAAAHPGALFVELGPGAVLSGLVRRIVPSAATMSVGTAEAVEQLLQQVA